MPKVTEEHKENRKQEIIDACEKIYKERGFTAVNIKEISTATSFTRPAIYSYSGNVSISRILCRMRLCIS